MGHRELLLTVGAMVIFSLTALAVNRRSLENSEGVYSQQIEFLALSHAQRFIEEAKPRAFDENSIDGVITNPNGFTNYPLGSGGTEDYAIFDDVDDFNGLTHTDTLGSRPGHETNTDFIMQTSISVVYVDEADLNTPVAYRTFYKKMTVTVTNPALLSPVRAEYVFAYKRI